MNEEVLHTLKKCCMQVNDHQGKGFNLSHLFSKES